MRSHRDGVVYHSILASALALFGCDNGPVGPQVCATPAGPFAVVVNGLSETLGVVADGASSADPCAPLLGDIPNDVAVDPSGLRALVVDSGDNDLLVVDLDRKLRVLSRIDLGVGTNPWNVAWRDEDRAFVSLWITGEVVEVDVSGGAIVSRTPVGTTPQALLLVGDRLLVTVTNFSFTSGFGPGEVVVLDVPTGDVLRRIAVGVNPQHLALAPDGRVHVVCTGNYGPAAPGLIHILDVETESVVDSVLIGGTPLSVAITSSGKAYVAAAGDGLLAYDALSLALVAPLGAPILATGGIFDLALEPAGSRLVVADFDDDALYFIDTGTDSVTATVTVGDGPVALAYRP